MADDIVTDDAREDGSPDARIDAVRRGIISDINEGLDLCKYAKVDQALVDGVSEDAMQEVVDGIRRRYADQGQIVDVKRHRTVLGTTAWRIRVCPPRSARAMAAVPAIAVFLIAAMILLVLT